MDKTVGYAKRAWHDLTSDKKWWKAVLALGLLNCLPIIGQVLVAGYLFDWAKEGAWNMKRPLPRELGNVSRRCKYGLYWLGCTVVWALPCYIVGLLVALIPVIGGLLQIVCNIVCVIALVLSSIGTVRSVIYERLYPGLQVLKVLRMAEHDLLGLCRAFCVLLLVVVVLVVALLLILIPALPLANMIESSGVDLLHGTGLIALIALGLTCVVTGLFVWIAATVCITLVVALYVRCIGYWTAQFDPAAWKAPSDPMPFETVRRQSGPVAPERVDGEENASTTSEESALDKLLVPLTEWSASNVSKAVREDAGDEAANDGAAGDMGEEPTERESAPAAAEAETQAKDDSAPEGPQPSDGAEADGDKS